MSKSDHSKSRKQERPGAMRINGELFAVPRRWHAAMPEREAIAESLADHVTEVVSAPEHEPVRYTSETTHMAPRSPFAVLTQPIAAPRKRVQHVHNRERTISRDLTRASHSMVDAGCDAPTPMQMAKARAKALGL